MILAGTERSLVIDQCGLARDLSLFEAGDNTEVGEKGLSLSGGQKVKAFYTNKNPSTNFGYLKG